MNRMINSFRFAINGVKTTWREEVNFRIETTIAILVIISMYYFGFNFIEKAICFLTIGLVLGFEMMNTVIEDLCNKVEPSMDPMIGKIKDVAGGAVFIVSFFSLLVGVSVFCNHFLNI